MTISLIEAPTSLGLSPNPERPDEPRGTWRAPDIYRSLGLQRRLDAADGGRVQPQSYRSERDPRTSGFNSREIAAFTRELAARLADPSNAGHWPWVLGGDCSVLLGAMLALRRRGKYGLLFLDGHLDFRHPGNTDRLGGVAGEDLAVVTGRGLPEHTNINGLRPYVQDRDVIAVGEREGDSGTADILRTEIDVINLDELRRLGGASRAVERALQGFERRGVDGFWIHVDLDVLDSQLMWAVDDPHPDGLGFEELGEALALAATSPLAVGGEATIFDPELDSAGKLAPRIVDLLVRGLADRSRI